MQTKPRRRRKGAYGPANHATRHDFKVVQRARLLRDRGYAPVEIQAHLRDEGHEVHKATIQDWLKGALRAMA